MRTLKSDFAKKIDRAVGRRVREVRVEAGLTQKQLAYKIGITYQQIHKYETGVNRISIGRLFEIAKFLDVPPSIFTDNLFEETKNSEFTRGGLELNRAFFSIHDADTRALVTRLTKVLAQAEVN